MSEVDKIIQMEVIFNAEGYRGKSVKRIVRKEKDYKSSYYPLYGEYVALQKGTIEFHFRNDPKQRRVVLSYRIDQESLAQTLVDSILPVPPEPVDPKVASRKARTVNSRRHKRQGSAKNLRTPMSA